MEPLEPEIFQNGIWYELRGEQYYPCLLPPEPDHTEDELLEIHSTDGKGAGYRRRFERV